MKFYSLSKNISFVLTISCSIFLMNCKKEKNSTIPPPSAPVITVFDSLKKTEGIWACTGTMTLPYHLVVNTSFSYADTTLFVTDTISLAFSGKNEDTLNVSGRGTLVFLENDTINKILIYEDTINPNDREGYHANLYYYYLKDSIYFDYITWNPGYSILEDLYAIKKL